MTKQEIQHCVLSTGKVDQLRALLDERRFKSGLHMTVDVESIDRTIDDLVGFYADGRFIGAAQIVEAFR